jgi:Ca2+/Na+ antiporter
MRRMTQVRLTDWAVRTLVIVMFFAFFFAPSRWVLPAVLVCFAIVGLWGIVYPEGVLGWAKTAHPIIDVNDSSIWWIPRLIGAFFLFFVVVLALAGVGRQ